MTRLAPVSGGLCDLFVFLEISFVDMMIQSSKGDQVGLTSVVLAAGVDK